MNRRLALIPFLLLAVIVLLSLIFPTVNKAAAVTDGINAADTAWMITATAFVLIMTPGLAFLRRNGE